MSTRWITRCLAVLLAASAAVTTPAVSHAATGVDDVTVAGGISFTPAVPVVSGSGSFTTMSTTCALASDGDLPPDSPVPETVPCSFSSSGSYLNVVCGTMTLTGTGVLTGEPEGPIPVSYTATIVNGAGVVTGTAQTGPSTGKVITGVVLVIASAFAPAPACIITGVIVYKWLFG